MNENTPSDDAEITPAPAPASPTPPTSRGRTGVLIAAFAAAVVLAAGIGAAFALVASGGDDDRIEFGQQSNASTPGPHDGGATVAGDQTDLDGMLNAAAQALTAVDGNVVAIEERSPGSWRIEVQGNGRETEVAVDASGVRILESDDDDDGDDLPLTAEVIEQIVAASTNHTAGRVVQIESDDNEYDVDVRTSTGSTVELELSSSFSVIDSDHDDDDD